MSSKGRLDATLSKEKQHVARISKLDGKVWSCIRPRAPSVLGDAGTRRQGTVWEKYHTYKWVNEVGGASVIGGLPDQILDSEIKDSIDSQLAAKGFQRVDSDKADLFVSYQAALDKERQWTAFGDNPWGPGWGEMGTATATSSTIYVGTLMLGICDPAAKQLLWIDAAQKTINPGKNQEKNRKNLDKALQKLLKHFPPGLK